MAQGKRESPSWVDPAAIVLRERGLEHERRYVEGLRAQGLSITDLSGTMGEDALAMEERRTRAPSGHPG